MAGLKEENESESGFFPRADCLAERDYALDTHRRV